jgi:SAM-dependent methyltransferase
MSHTEQDLINWKTDAWKDRNMVAWYSNFMVGTSGTNRLKNLVETALCERYLTGQAILDVGIGTGRASLPLIDKGYRVSGTDSSQAMLDECRRLAAGRPIELVPGDVQALPFGDASFDSLISLNVMTHFPHVEPVLREWQRVVKPGGRLIFDIYSLDHLSFARGREVTLDDLLAQGNEKFNMHLSSEALVQIADDIGLRIVAAVPYGSLFSGEYKHWTLPMPLQASHWWKRQLSWIATDDAMLAMAAFLEQHWFACLTTITTGRFMAVLEKPLDLAADSAADTAVDPAAHGAEHAAANRDWLAEHMSLSRDLVSAPVRLDDLAPYLQMPAAQWREQFDRHLDHPRNRTLAYFVLSTCLGRMEAIDWLDLAPRNGPALQRWIKAEVVDRLLQEFVVNWHREPAVADLCRRHEVDLGAGLDYLLLRRFVAQYAKPSEPRHS